MVSGVHRFTCTTPSIWHEAKRRLSSSRYVSLSSQMVAIPLCPLPASACLFSSCDNIPHRRTSVTDLPLMLSRPPMILSSHEDLNCHTPA